MKHKSLNYLEQIPGSIAVFDTQLRYISYTAQWEKDYALEEVKLLGKSLYDAIPEFTQEWRRLHQRCLLGETIIKDRDRLMRSDGKVQWLQWVGAPWYEDGNIGGVIINSSDITQKVLSEQDVIHQKRSLDEAQRLAQIGHWELDLRYDHLYWSDEVYRIFGLKPQQFKATYRAFLERVHQDDRDKVNQAYSESVENKTSYHTIHRIQTVTGEERIVEERCLHDFDDQGAVFRSIGTVHDITEKVLAQKEIAMASLVFEHTTEGILITDAAQQIVMVNRAFEHISGYTKSEVIGKTPKILSSGWATDEFYQNMWLTLETEGTWSGEIWDRKKSGDLYAADLTIIIVTNEEGLAVNYIAITNDITEKKEREKTINKLSYYDFLTAIPNRVLFKEHVELTIKQSTQHQENFAFMYCDLDNFKIINDSLGHQAGDKLLIEVTKRIKHVLGDNAFVGRLGGDEFAIILHHYKNLSDISNIASELIDAVSQLMVIEDNPVVTGVSIGIALFPENGTVYDTLYKNADAAMYSIKKSGKNGFHYFSDEIDAQAKKRFSLEAKLRNALVKKEFKLVYQPKKSLASGKLYGAEALIRWYCKEQERYIPPFEFIPIAEESGLIGEIGLWVFEQVLKDSKKWKGLKVSVNVSGLQLEDASFSYRISELLQQYRADASLYEIEITESVLMENLAKKKTVLHDIKNLGMSISIDDFGTGYSSMEYLKTLPIDTLKIDRAFIKDIDSDENDRAITVAILALCKALGLRSVAEGVETKNIEKRLIDMGCDFYQGYYYAKPMECSELVEFIDSH